MRFNTLKTVVWVLPNAVWKLEQNYFNYDNLAIPLEVKCIRKYKPLI